MIAVAAALVFAAPAMAQDAEPTPLVQLAAADQRLIDIGWRLTRGSAELCPDTRPAIGLLLVDVRSFGDPEAVRQERALTGDIAVQAVAAGSPADLAGLSYNHSIDRVVGVAVDDVPAEEKSDWRRQARLQEAIETSLQMYGTADIAQPVSEPLSIIGEPACYSRFEVLGNSDRAMADGIRMVLGDRWLAADQPDDEIAFLIAHELAHNILKHRLRRDLPKRQRPSAKDVEREADRLAPWLMANAGYDPRGAVVFLERHGPKQDGPLYLSFTHDGWKKRREAVEAEIAAMAALPKVDGRYDWTGVFADELAAARAVMQP